MYPAAFDYLRVASVAEALAALEAHPDGQLLAGGHSLLPALKLRLAQPATLIDIGRIAELRGISTDSDGFLRIGALTTHAEIAASDAVKEHAAALAEAASQIGDPAVRNRGTIGGNLAHADPASDLPTVLAALGATLTVAGKDGERSIDASDFFTGVMMTALGEDDLLTSIQVPSAAGRGTAYVKFSHPASRYAVIGVAASVGIGTKGGGWMSKFKGEPKETVCTGAVVAIGGLVPKPVRCSAVEEALNDQSPSDETFAAAAAAVSGDLGDDLLGDIFASADYRKAVAPVYVRRALAAATERAG
jgi:carbon-monoxide dehydrogenase medium subunit